MAVASGDPGQSGSVKLYKVDPKGAVTFDRELLDSNDCVFAVTFSPDGTKVASGGADRAIRIWEVATGKELAVIEDHADWVLDIAFSPDGKRLASGARDKTSKVFDVIKKESLVTFPAHAEPVHAVLFLADGVHVASAGNDNLIRVWNPDQDAKQARQMGGFGGAVFRGVLSPDGKLLAATGADKIVRVFDPTNGSQKFALTGHNDWLYSLAISPNGKTLASGGIDGEVRLWNLADGKPIRTILAAPGLNPLGKLQASAK